MTFRSLWVDLIDRPTCRILDFTTRLLPHNHGTRTKTQLSISGGRRKGKVTAAVTQDSSPLGKMPATTQRKTDDSVAPMFTKRSKAPENLADDSCSTMSTRSMKSLNDPCVVEFAELWLLYMNEHNLKGMTDIVHDECTVNFVESQMPYHEFSEEIKNLFSSFPDLSFAWNDVKQTSPNIVEIGVFQASGTHTGKPYGFGPYPPIESKGIAVKNDPEKVIIEVLQGKIKKVTFIPSSELTGPPGIYVQIGGFPI
eukprot:scaffold46265_cov183-Amphora_coffeaeformis.AAC.4